MRISKLVIVAAAFLASNGVFAQSDKEKAHTLGVKAVHLEDEGKYDEALDLLDQAQRLDPDSYIYPYEIGFTYYAEKDYIKALDVFKKITKYKDANDQVWQMIGNIYDIAGDSANAIKAYDDGLKLFPNSGKLFLEKGNVYWLKKQYDKALGFYEQGIQAEPAFPSNYYRATLLYCSSSEEVWGMIYGEIFMNLERNSGRTSEISKLLYDTYKSQITYKGKGNVNVSFCKQMVINVDDLKDTSKMKLPFCMVYEPTIAVAAAFQKKIDINSLDAIRQNFLDDYFKKGFNKSYPNVLFDFQNTLKTEGHLEAYNHWLLMKGDEKAFEKWREKNEGKYQDFIAWFTENKMKVDDKNKFYRAQY